MILFFKGEKGFFKGFKIEGHYNIDWGSPDHGRWK